LNKKVKSVNQGLNSPYFEREGGEKKGMGEKSRLCARAKKGGDLELGECHGGGKRGT